MLLFSSRLDEASSKHVIKKVCKSYAGSYSPAPHASSSSHLMNLSLLDWIKHHYNLLLNVENVQGTTIHDHHGEPEWFNPSLFCRLPYKAHLHSIQTYQTQVHMQWRQPHIAP